MSTLSPTALTLPMYLLMNTYSRMQNMINDDLPKGRIETIIDQKTKEGWKGAAFEPERMFRVPPYDFDDETMINQWVEESVCYAIMKLRQERLLPEKDLLHLFRLLCIKFRAEVPGRTGRRFIIREELKNVLDAKICSYMILQFDKLKIKDHPHPDEARVVAAGTSVERQRGAPKPKAVVKL
jgi:hypothetical protein